MFFKDTVAAACSKNNPFSEFMLSLAEEILDEMGRSKRKKLFSELLNEANENDESRIRAFIDGYEKKHEGFFNKLFGSKGKRDEEEDEPSSESPKRRKK